jgi:chorismate mutase/prephenate dehydratase
MSLEEHRKAIDAVDKKLVRLLNERTGHALAIGAIKLESGEEIYAPHRERLIFQRLAKLNNGPIPEESMRAIYREIMSCSLSLEKSLTVAYLGPEATYTHQAAIRKFGSSLRYTPQKTIGDVFADVQKDRADYGVVPIENSTEGVVTHTLDLFVDSPLKIVAQIVMPIQHCLVRGNRRTKVRRLYSHPQALAQCRVWMQQNLPSVEVIEASSTTRAAEKAAEDKAASAVPPRKTTAPASSSASRTRSAHCTRLWGRSANTAST